MIFFLALLLIAAIGCGSGDDQVAQDASKQESTVTSYGTLEEVSGYLRSVNPYIRTVGELQVEVDKVVGTSGKATGQNLAVVMEAVRPRLKTALEQFEKIQPPPLLAPLHRDIKKLMLVRLEAYDITLKGWQAEQATEDTTIYKDAESKLAAANQMIEQLNQDLREINSAIQVARETEGHASSE